MITDMDKTAKIAVRVPFEFCGVCPHIMPEKTTFVVGKAPYTTIFECVNRKICANAVRGYQRMMKDNLGKRD